MLDDTHYAILQILHDSPEPITVDQLQSDGQHEDRFATITQMILLGLIAFEGDGLVLRRRGLKQLLKRTQ